jgi:hypothetical protein
MVLFWSLNYIVGKVALREFPPLLLGGLRTAFAGALILPVYAWAARRNKGKHGWTRADVPRLAWGPYLWADGVRARADGLTWVRGDLGPDGTHPDTAGRQKVARMLLEFLKTEATARPWFLK